MYTTCNYIKRRYAKMDRLRPVSYTHLDVYKRQELVSMLEKIFDDGVKLFLVEHNMDVVMNLCHQITVLSFGKKIAEGSPKETQEHPEVIKAYLGDRYKKV